MNHTELIVSGCTEFLVNRFTSKQSLENLNRINLILSLLAPFICEVYSVFGLLKTINKKLHVLVWVGFGRLRKENFWKFKVANKGLFVSADGWKLLQMDSCLVL